MLRREAVTGCDKIFRWAALSGYACATILLVVIANRKWITLVFPAWMLLVSVNILVADVRPRRSVNA